MRFLSNLIFLSLFSAMCSLAIAQNSEEKKSDYLVIDLSKSHPTNRVHDHLYYLTTNSISVDLPAEVVEFLESIPDGDNPDIHAKYNYQRSEILKVLYNEKISPEDKRFICNHYLGYTDNDGITPIQPMLQKYLDEGTL